MVKFSFCNILWTFAFIFAALLLCLNIVRNWDFCTPLPIFIGFVVGRKERIERKLEIWSKLVNKFDRKLKEVRRKGVWLCPKCFSEKVKRREKPKPEDGHLGGLECKKCGCHFRREKLPVELEIEAPARIVNQIIRLTEKGLRIWDTHEEIVETARDYNFHYEFGRTTIYDIREKIAELHSWFERFLISGLLEGLPCDRLEVDEIFLHSSHRKELLKYLAGGRKPRRFYYLIDSICSSNRYSPEPEVAESRNKNAFISFVLRLGAYLRNDPRIINSDELRQLKSALKIRFQASVLDTTKRVNGIKLNADKTALIERLHRTIRRTLPKKRKLRARRHARILANINRMMHIYIQKHQTLKKRVIETIVPFPKNIRSPSDFIFFMSFIKHEWKNILGDEFEIFENPILGRCVITLQVSPDAIKLFSNSIRDMHLILALNAWAPPHDRDRIIEGYLKSKLFDIPIPLRLNTYLMRTVREEEKGYIHFVGDLPAGIYTIAIPITLYGLPAVLCLESVWIDAGKTCHHVFTFNREELFHQLRAQWLHNYLNQNKFPRDIFFARRVNCEVSCPAQVNVPPPEWAEKVAPLISELKRIAHIFDAEHLISLAFWTAYETLIKRPRPVSIDDYIRTSSERTRKLLLATFYVILNVLTMEIGVKEYVKILEEIDDSDLSSLIDNISVSIERLQRRLMSPKSVLGRMLRFYRRLWDEHKPSGQA